MHGVWGGGEEVVEVVGEVEVGDWLSGELAFMIMVKKDLSKVCLIVREVHDPWNHGTKSKLRVPGGCGVHLVFALLVLFKMLLEEYVPMIQCKSEGTKEIPNGNVCWWFVLHDDEASLQAIDGKWEQVKLQTSWKLEPCFRLSPAPPVQPPAPPSGSSIGVVGAPVSETLTTAGVLSTTPVLSTSRQPASSKPPSFNIVTTSMFYTTTTPNTPSYL